MCLLLFSCKVFIKTLEYLSFYLIFIIELYLLVLFLSQEITQIINLSKSAYFNFIH